MKPSSRVPAAVRQLVTDAIGDRESITASEVAVVVVNQARRELRVDARRFQVSTLRLLAARGATDFVRVIAKTLVDAVAVGDDATLPLFEGLAGMVWIKDAAGVNLFKRLDRLTQDEYLQMLQLLRRTSATLATKIERYEAAYKRVRHFWLEGMTFGDAYAAMMRGVAPDAQQPPRPA
jgi:hypothetical protein